MKKLKKTIKILLIISIIFTLIYISLYIYASFTKKLPIDKSNNYSIYDKNNELFTTNENNWVNISDISQNLINATISIEDKNFYNHIGFDYLRILKALYTNLTAKTKQGASTITQQYAKNLFLDFGKTWKRKLEEAWLTIRIESNYSKNEILEGYLNTINYGGVFGIENASLYYFNKHARDLTLSEATILAGIPKNPTYYSPISNNENALVRQKTILESMVKNKYITNEEKEKALNEELTYTSTSNEKKNNSLMYYQDAVIEELKSIKSIPPSFLETKGLKIYTCLDNNAQTILDESIKNNLTNNEDIQVSSVIINPNTGGILAIAGGRDYSKSQYNRVTQSKRQVGSTIKPFLYYAALENSFTSSSTFMSEKTTFVFGENKTYSPKNFSDLYPNKSITMAAAIAYSDNIYAVKTHMFLGEDALVNNLKRLGINEDLESLPSLALGSQEINMLEMIQAYSALANEGYKIEPYFITKICDKNDVVLYEREEKKEAVLNENLVYILNEMLTNTYSSDFIDYNYPTLISFSGKLKNKYAIKTGTTDTDRLIFGYNKNYLMGVWTGYDDNRDTPSQDLSISKNIWLETSEKYLNETDDNWYTIPQNVVGVLVNPITGEIANENTRTKKMFYYLKGTEPTYNDKNLDLLIPTIKEERVE